MNVVEGFTIGAIHSPLMLIFHANGPAYMYRYESPQYHSFTVHHMRFACHPWRWLLESRIRRLSVTVVGVYSVESSAEVHTYYTEIVKR